MDQVGGGNHSDEDQDEYVNITITPIDQSDKGSTKSLPIPASTSSSSSLLPTDDRTPAASPKKGFSILSTSPGLFLRKRNNKNSEALSGSPRASPELRRQNRTETGPSPRGSPELGTKLEHRKNLEENSSTKKVPLQRRRSKSDVGLPSLEKQVFEIFM